MQSRGGGGEQGGSNERGEDGAFVLATMHFFPPFNLG